MAKLTESVPKTNSNYSAIFTQIG